MTQFEKSIIKDWEKEYKEQSEGKDEK